MQSPESDTVEAADVTIPEQESVPLPVIETESPMGHNLSLKRLPKQQRMASKKCKLRVTNWKKRTFLYQRQTSPKKLKKRPEPVEEPQTEIEIEFRALVTELMANGVEPSDMVDDHAGNRSTSEQRLSDSKLGRLHGINIGPVKG